MAKLSKKQKEILKDTLKNDLFESVHNIIMENGFLIKKEYWGVGAMDIRATYDSYRILNIVNNKIDEIL